MIKKYLTLKMCILLFIIAALPLSGIAVETNNLEEPLGFKYNLLIIKQKLKEKKKIKSSAFAQKIILKITSKGTFVNKTRPHKKLTFLLARFHLSNYVSTRLSLQIS